MKVIKSILLFLLTIIAPCVVLYLIFEGLALKLILAPYILIWALIYIYIDKILLINLSAREVIDTDEQLLFQNVKNQSYKSFEKPPRVYLYSGQKLNCFVLESRNEWAIVIERGLLEQLEPNQLESVVNFLYKYKRSRSAWYQTKAMGICVLVYNIIYWLLRNILMLKVEMKLFKVLSVFSLVVMRPILAPLESLAKKSKSFPADENLKPIYLQLERRKFSFSEFILGHLSEKIDIKALLVNYLESYPVLENCGFDKNEIQ